jgi:hypothetical protein
MTNQHPITPPPELVNQWCDKDPGGFEMFDRLATQAARWGADQELEACCEWLLADFHYVPVCGLIEDLRAARRPKPPSLKEQALEALKVIECEYVIGATTSIIRRALEAQP